MARALVSKDDTGDGAVMFRPTEEDFVVEEIPAYLPVGSGEHLYLHIEKRGLSTPEMLRRLRQVFDLDERDVGFAGQKDAWGVTRQWVSVPARHVEPRVSELEAAVGVRLLEAKRHQNKLRLGHSRGNAFSLVVQGELSLPALQERARCLADSGTPNYFGAQRFGHQDRVLRDAERFLLRPRPARTRRELFWVSAVQSAIFNAWLSDRVGDGSWTSALDGDVLQKTDNGAPFLCDDPIKDATRAAAGEVSCTGPLHGQRMRCAERDALTCESRSAERIGVNVAELLRHPAFASGARRAGRVFVDGMDLQPVAGGFRISFSLPPGSYASVFLRELVGPRLLDAAFADAPTPPAAAVERT